MSRLTAFQLFIKQALQYPLASPFLPPENKVEKDYSYANGQKTGEMYPGTKPREWQTIQNLRFNYANAVHYAQYLEADGVTVASTPQNIWRLPTTSEYAYDLINDNWDWGSHEPGGFTYNDTFRTSEEDVGYGHMTVDNYYGYIIIDSGPDNLNLMVRCLKI